MNYPKKIEFFNENVRDMCCGSHHTGFVTDQGELFMCGANQVGQLGIGNKECQLFPANVTLLKGIVVQVACGVFHSLILLSTYY